MFPHIGVIVRRLLVESTRSPGAKSGARPGVKVVTVV